MVQRPQGRFVFQPSRYFQMCHTAWKIANMMKFPCQSLIVCVFTVEIKDEATLCFANVSTTVNERSCWHWIRPHEWPWHFRALSTAFIRQYRKMLAMLLYAWKTKSTQHLSNNVSCSVDWKGGIPFPMRRYSRFTPHPPKEGRKSKERMRCIVIILYLAQILPSCFKSTFIVLVCMISSVREDINPLLLFF